MKRIVVAALLSAFMATPALADNTGRFYLAADFGSATYSKTFTDTFGWSNPNVIRIAGGYHFSPLFAVEMGYSTFGDSNSATGYNSAPATTSASSFQIAAVGSIPLTRQFALIGKLGLASNFEDYSDAAGYSYSYSYNDFLIGVGAQLYVNQQVSVRALYEDYGKFDNTYLPMKATSFTVGVAYDF